MADAVAHSGSAGSQSERPPGKDREASRRATGTERGGIAELRPVEAEAGERAEDVRKLLRVLAAVGLYGVLSAAVRQRTAEIGVRMALGAQPSSIFQLMVGQGLRLSAAGIALGIVVAFGLTRVMISMLIGVRPTDPLTFVAMA